MISRGKQFEEKFKNDWSKTFPESFIYRLPDQMSGYKNQSKNICDFFCFHVNTLYLIECKSHSGASIPIENITQHEKMRKKIGIRGVRTGVILWLYDKDKVLYIPSATVEQLIKEGQKSIGIRHLNDYNIITIPSTKKRVFMDSDYSILLNLKEGE